MMGSFHYHAIKILKFYNKISQLNEWFSRKLQITWHSFPNWPTTDGRSSCEEYFIKILRHLQLEKKNESHDAAGPSHLFESSGLVYHLFSKLEIFLWFQGRPIVELYIGLIFNYKLDLDYLPSGSTIPFWWIT